MAIAERAASRVEPEVSGVMLRVLADAAMKHDLAPATLFQGDAERFVGGAPMDVRVPWSAYAALVRRAIALTGEPALGLRCGFSASEASYDLLAPLLAHVPTLRHALREAGQFQALVFEGAHLHIDEGAGVARLRCELPRCDAQSDRFAAELVLSGLLRMLYAFGGTRADVHAVRFEHRRPDYPRAYADVFRGAERFGEPVTSFEFASALLDRPHLHCNAALQSLVHGQAEQRLAQLARPMSLVQRLQAYLVQQPADAVPDMDVAARRLGVSVRSLRRRLAEAGVSYRALTQALQRERACSLLRNPDLSLQAVADALGFADLVAFHRAFKRWTGQTALQYRAACAR